jgi:ribosomal protein L11 methylase PrmA
VTDSTGRRHSASFRDPSGFLFQQDGQLYRQINQVYRADYEQLMSSGLYQKLTRQGLLIPHEETTVAPAVPDISYKIIQPERVPFISYPYEWSFFQLKEAALLTLKIQRLALQASMVLKDASAYNIQFLRGAPVLIDTLSFAAYHPGDPWVAYRQFCQMFLAPLALMSHTDVRCSDLLRIHIDGIPLDLASKLLPGSTRLNFGLMSHIHAHAAAQQRFSSPSAEGRDRKAQLSQTAMIGLVDSLEGTVKKLDWKPGGTAWADYYDATNYTEQALEVNKQVVQEWITEIAPRRIFDLGANTGLFSRLALNGEHCLVISTDNDPGAIEINYLENKKNHLNQVLPLVIDLTNPSPAIGWRNTERLSFIERGPADLVMALALIHHLAISNNVPLEEISSFLASLGQALIIEFVPKEDSQVQKLLASRQDIFPDYALEGFSRAFANDFKLIKQTPIPGTQRTLFLFEKKPDR